MNFLPYNNSLISIFFSCNYGDRYLIRINNNETLFTLFQKFKELSGNYNEDINFIYNGTKLNNLNLMTTLKEANIEDNKSITVSKNNCLKGGISVNFCDLSKQIYEDHYFSNKAPSFRIVVEGINIYGICKSKKCIAYNKEVVVPLKDIYKFDLIKERENLECPVCEGLIIPKTFGFHLCEYFVKGKKYENNKIQPFEFKGIANNKNAIQYYDPEKNGIVNIIELVIEIIKFL